ncbi:hypothetical protein OPQ81_009265 [Rhizoctonia solani]|nr:hypothetical protein OPQ81_009265 [Rhizoctonia solani]
MTTYTLSRTSPRNTVLTAPDGNVAYKISTPFALKDANTTITRADESDVVAVIHWNALRKNELTMKGTTVRVDDVFPKTKRLNLGSRSRVYTTADGEKFEWKYTIRLYCISELTGLNIATYYRILFVGLRGKKSTLDIAPSALHLSDILVVTWAIMEGERGRLGCLSPESESVLQIC